MLRGTYKKSHKMVVAKAMKPSLQQQINDLKINVGRNKPEIQYFRGDGAITSTGTGTEQNAINITQSLIASSTFRDLIIGDKWTNIALSLYFYLTPDLTHFRYVVYVPKKTGTSFTPASNPFVRQPDPSAFWVLADRAVTCDPNSGGFKSIQKTVKLNRLKSIYNLDSTTLEKGEIKVLLITNGTTSASQQLTYGFKLTFANK